MRSSASSSHIISSPIFRLGLRPQPALALLHVLSIVLVVLHEAGPWLRRYQLLQEREDRVRLYVVPSSAPTHSELHRLHSGVSAVLGTGVMFQVTLVEDIPLERTGKFRVSRSLVRSAYDGVDWGA